MCIEDKAFTLYSFIKFEIKITFNGYDDGVVPENLKLVKINDQGQPTEVNYASIPSCTSSTNTCTVKVTITTSPEVTGIPAGNYKIEYTIVDQTLKYSDTIEVKSKTTPSVSFTPVKDIIEGDTEFEICILRYVFL